MRRRLFAAGALIALVALGVQVGAAASQAITSSGLGAASTSVPRCTTAGLGIIQNLTASTVASVTVSGLPAGCGGATLQVAVNNGTSSTSGSAAVPGAGGSVTVTMAVPPAVSATEQIDLLLVGP
jgi:hypothetical protein